VQLPQSHEVVELRCGNAKPPALDLDGWLCSDGVGHGPPRALEALAIRGARRVRCLGTDTIRYCEHFTEEVQTPRLR